MEYQDRHGRTFRWEAFQRKGVKGIVVVVPFTSDDQVVLVKQFRPPVERYVIEFPAGLNDNDEPLFEVARRELLEETGYLAHRITPLLKCPLTAGSSADLITIFVATELEHKDSQSLDEVEDIEVITVPVNGFYEKLLELEDENTLLDIKIAGFFELARRVVDRC